MKIDFGSHEVVIFKPKVCCSNKKSQTSDKKLGIFVRSFKFCKFHDFTIKKLLLDVKSCGFVKFDIYLILQKVAIFDRFILQEKIVSFR